MPPNANVLRGSSLSKEDNPRLLNHKSTSNARNLCILALFLGWSSSILCIVMGCYMIYIPLPLDSVFNGKYVQIGASYYCFSAGLEENGDFNQRGHRIYAMPKDIQLLVTLGLSTTANILLDCLGYIHATTLRWALVRENRLQTNSNLRFFSRSKFSFANKWYMNAISLLGFTITFGALPSITMDAQVVGGCTLEEGTKDAFTTYPSTSYQNGLDFNGVGIISLGIGILLQDFVSTCALSKSAFVATWSSDPLTNAKCYHDSHAFPSASTSLYHSNNLHCSCNESLSARPVSSANAEPTSGNTNIMPPSRQSRMASPLLCRFCQISYTYPQECQPSMLSALPNA